MQKFDIDNQHFKVTRVVWYNKESEWGVLATDPLFKLDNVHPELINKYGNVSVTGNFSGVYEGAELVLSGDIVDGRYGKSIQIRSYSIIHDSKSKEGIVNFLAKSLIKGISVQNAKKIYEQFKEDSIEIILEQPERVKQVKGIGDKTAKKIIDSVVQYRVMRPLIEYCTSLGLHFSIIKKLDEELGNEALPVIQEDPYKVLDLTSTITFKQMDEVFLKKGGSPTAPVRLKTGLLYVLKNLVTLEGSTGCKSSSLKNKFYSMLGLEGENNEYESIVHKLYLEGKVELTEGAITGYETGYVYYVPFVKLEKSISEKIKILNTYGMLSDKIDEQVVDEEIHDFPFTLNDKQVEAVHECLKHNVSVLTGAAGCVAGDTIISVLLASEPKVKDEDWDYYKYDCEENKRQYCFKTYTIKEFYNRKNKKRYPCAYILSFLEHEPEDDIIYFQRVKDVVYSGRKPVWELILACGERIIATSDHEILTTEGWVELKDLTAEDRVYVSDYDLDDDTVEDFWHGDKLACGINRVVEVKDLHKEVDTYDICCPYDHNFIANGIVVHNSGKSSITKALSRIYRRCGFTVYHLSPTAKACRRLEECIGTSDAQTIHKFLGMTKDGECKGRGSYADDTVLIIDDAVHAVAKSWTQLSD